MADEEIVKQLRGLVDDALAATDQEPLGLELPQDVFLPDVIDSLAIATLIALIEDRWDFEVDDEDIDPEVFETLSSVADYIEGRLDPGSEDEAAQR